MQHSWLRLENTPTASLQRRMTPQQLRIVLYMILNNLMMEFLFTVITPRSTLTQSVVPVKVPSVGQIEQFYHLVCLNPFNCVQTNDW